jgi:hypothetical protein
LTHDWAEIAESDRVVRRMLRDGLPLDRATYIDLAFGDKNEPPEGWPAELLETLPLPFRPEPALS